MRALTNSLLALLLCVSLPVAAQSSDSGAAGGTEGSAKLSPEEEAYFQKLRALNWVKGPAQATVAGNSTLQIPEGYAFLDRADTDKFLTLNGNLSSGEEVMIAPQNLQWSAYLSFSDEGYVKDDEKIDASALLKSMKDATEASNAERKRRGYPELHVIDWAVQPAYNTETKRLEWATTLQSPGGQSVNFFTKVLGRRGFTTVILVSAPENLRSAESALDTVLGGYRFNPGETYAEYKKGDKVAEYGLAALILGGAAAVATKKGLWGVIGGFIAAGWKVIAAAVVGLGAWFRNLFRKKQG